MPKLVRNLVPLALSMLLAMAPASAAQIIIDFEHLPGPDGRMNTADDTPTSSDYMQPLGNLFSAAGIVFEQGTLFQDSFFDGNPRNHFISSTNPIGRFTVPVTGISIESHSSWDAILTAYGQSGEVLASYTLAHPNPGNERLRGVLSVSSATPIYGFAVLPVNPNHILNLDNLSLTTGDVPEPGQLALFGLGALMLAGIRRRTPL